MRYIWTFIWAFLLSNMMNYVLANMQSLNYSFKGATIMAVVFTIVVAILGDGIIKEEAAN